MKIINCIVKVKNKIEKYYVRFKVKYSKYEYGLTKNGNSTPIIVSLTTFPKRINQIDLCLKSILLQKMKPDRIIVWLGSDSNEDELNPILKKYEKYGIEFIYDKDNDFKSHKKYIYSFKNYKDSIIITLDDDLIYPMDIISSLVRKYNKYPNCIIARRVHKITFDDENNIKKYREWGYECKSIKEPSHFLLATTGAGTLFPPNIMPDITTEFDLIKKLALTTDDLWIKFIALKNNIKIVWVGDTYQMPETVEYIQESALNHINIFKNKNDENIRYMMEYFNLSRQDFNK